MLYAQNNSKQSTNKRHGLTLLHVAAFKGDLNAISYLINKVDINQVDKDGNTALHYAAAMGHQAALDILLKAGANPSLTNNINLTVDQIRSINEQQSIQNDLSPIHRASKYGIPIIVTTLLKKGADSNAQTVKHGLTPLHYAAHNGDRKTIKTLLKHQADPNRVDFHGDTSLHYAVILDQPKALNDLINAGGDVYLKNSHGLNVDLVYPIMKFRVKEKKKKTRNK